MANVRSWLVPVGTVIIIAVALVLLDGLIFGKATMLSHLAFWPVLLLVIAFVGGGFYFWVKDDKPFNKLKSPALLTVFAVALVWKAVALLIIGALVGAALLLYWVFGRGPLYRK